jgi:hypothetical protein
VKEDKEKKRQKRFIAEAAGAAGRDHSPAPARGASPAVDAAAAAAAIRRKTPPPGSAGSRGTPPPNRGRTPPLGLAGAASVLKRSATPPGAAVAMAAGAAGAMRGRTPPVEGMSGGKRRPEDAGGEGRQGPGVQECCEIMLAIGMQVKSSPM